MVFVEAARKTGGFMAISALLGVGIVTFLTEDLASPSGLVVASPAETLAGSGWLIFVLGLFMGAMMIGTYFYIAHVEQRRDE